MSADEPLLSSAELKVAHESLGVSTAFLAERTGKSSRMIWHYERRGGVVPDDVARVVIDLVNTRDETVESIISWLVAYDADVIERTSLEQFEHDRPAMAGWGEQAYGLVLAEVQRRLRLPIDWSETS